MLHIYRKVWNPAISAIGITLGVEAALKIKIITLQSIYFHINRHYAKVKLDF